MQARRVSAIGAAIVGLLVVLIPGTIATADTSTKFYTLTSPASTVPAGDRLQGSSYALTLGNTPQSQQNLGSANISLSPTTNGFLIQGACLSPENVCSDTTNSFVSVVGGVIQLRNLALVPGSAVTISVHGYAPCLQEQDTWNAFVKQANNFSGSPGNGFLLSGPLPQLSLTANTSCSLSFAAGEPNDAQINTAITTKQLNSPPGSAVQVDVLGAGGGVAVASNDPVTVAVNNPNGTNPAPALSSSTANPAYASSGVALFPGLSINQSGSGYVLTATSPSINQGTSNAFNIWDAVTDCGPGTKAGSTCDAKDSNAGQSSEINGSAGNNPAAVAASLESYLNEPCGDTNSHAPFETTLTSINLTGSTKTVTITILNPVAAASQYQVCYQSQTPFTDRAGNIGVLTGLLPDCKFAGPPCVVSITKNRQGSVVELISLPAGDPHTW